MSPVGVVGVADDEQEERVIVGLRIKEAGPFGMISAAKRHCTECGEQVKVAPTSLDIEALPNGTTTWMCTQCAGIDSPAAFDKAITDGIPNLPGAEVHMHVRVPGTDKCRCGIDYNKVAQEAPGWFDK